MVYKVKNIKSHPQHPYPETSLEYDFALLELKGTVPLSINVSVVCLDSSPPEAHIGRDMLISGFGRSGITFY